MKGSEAKMISFMEGADKRYVIPVYQRKYDWKYENCQQLYNDLKKIVIDERDSHFFGSIVSAVVPNGSKIEYHIIDGQQRLTTITLLLLAIRNLIAQGKVMTDEGKLDDQISQRFLISPWASEDDKIKLRPVKSDRDALEKLFGDEEDYDHSSNLTINYKFFYDIVKKEEISVSDLYAAIGKLEIISITLDQGDNAQLIFESLNSTGLALTEGDKIRNYVLMGLPAQEQTKYYDTYWAKIEKCTNNDVSGFIRDYLSIKQQVTPTISNVYKAFKDYVEFDSYTLDDENFDFTGRDIAKYSYLNIEQPVTSWTDMFEHIIKYLHQKDKSVLMTLAYNNKENTDLANYVSNNESNLRSALKIDENLYIEKNTSTALKMSILRRIFPLYKADPMDLIFYLKDLKMKKLSDTNRFDIRRRYWEYALPIIQEENMYRGTFSGCNPTTSNTESGFFGIRGICISCIANYDNARIDFYLGNGEKKKNKEIFDMLYKYKNEIESKLGISLDWNRADDYKASWMSYYLNNVSITNEADWPIMAKFHAEWSKKISSIMLDYLLTDEEKRMDNIVAIFKEWAQSKSEIHLDISRCNRTYTRFTTNKMSLILPDIPGSSSGWNTDNHYFYEIVNRNGKQSYIQLAISSKNITDDFRAICDEINQHYPAKLKKENWQWRTPFRTKTFDLGENLDKMDIFSKLNFCLDEVLAFELDLSNKMGKNLE